ncbi:MAG: hypothetical protein ACJ75J_02880 [Cytophagaceae bacterium]
MHLLKKNIFWCLLALFACNFNPDKQVVPAWEMDFIGPIVKADLNIQNIAHIENLYASKSLSLSDFGIPTPGVPTTIPAFGPVNMGPYALNLTSAFKSANMASGNLYFKITDGLEIDIKAGAKILINDASGNIITQTLPAISRLGGVYTSPITDMANKNIGSDLQLSVQNFSSNGSGGVVTIDPSRRLTMEIFLDNVLVNTITLSNSNSFLIADTSDFRITGTGVQSTSVAGTFTTFVTNDLPLRFNMQVYLLDATKSIVLDSLFDTTVLIDSASGGVPHESQFVTSVNNTKLDNLNKAYFAYSKMQLLTPPNATIANSLLLKSQIVGDLQIKLNK